MPELVSSTRRMAADFASLDTRTIESLLDRYHPHRTAGTLVWFALRTPLRVVDHRTFPVDALPAPGHLFRESLPARPDRVLPIRIEATLPFDAEDRHLAMAIMFAGEILDIPMLAYARATPDPPALHQLPLLDLLWSHIMTRKFLDSPDA